MLKDQVIKDVLITALSTGADFAEIFLEDKVSNNLQAEGGVISSANNSHIKGAGIRVFKEKEVVYGYSNNLETDKLLKLASDLASSFNGAPIISEIIFNKTSSKDKHKAKIHPKDVSIEQKAKYITDAHNYAKSYDECISQTRITLSDVAQEILIVNSNGKYVTDTRVRTRIYITSIASKDGQMQTGSEGPGGLVGYELFDEINLKEVAIDTARVAKTMAEAEECPSKEMPVIMNNGFGGVIFHEACGHPLEATTVARGLSVFCGKLGTKIASELVTAIDDATIPNAWGSGNIDDEGNPTENIVLIKDGILKSYLVDSFNTRLMDHELRSCGRRESYKFMPTSRMSNTFIDNGTSTFDEIIENTEYGLFAARLGGGSVNPITGDFNFAVMEGYIVENGKISKPVRGATLVGNGAEVLHKIDMIADNLERAQGMCGSSSGSIPADVGQPTLRVSKMTVGGRKGAN
ncbi:TldD/PmbA family protein [Mycoplasmatota bacterium]|nr:TldD/PmbA family protein [Mycoplasmatota bacterium]